MREHVLSPLLAIVALTLCACSVPALADCTLPSTPNDGYLDQSWAGKGCITFAVDNRKSSSGTARICSNRLATDEDS